MFTGPDGVFSTGDLPVGTYNIYVEGPPGSDFVSEWYEDVLFRGAATDIVLTENGDTEAFVIALGTSPYHVTGTVEADGSPVEGASVSVLYGTLATYDPTSPSAFAETDANGDYNSQGLVSGTYVVIARWYDPVDEVSYVSEPQEVVIDDASAELDLQVVVEEDIITVTTGRPDHYATPENTVLNVSAAAGLLANDTVVPPSDEFEVGDLLSLPQHGEVFVSYSGALTYAPETGFTGTDTFTYESGPEGQGSGAVLVTIQVGTLPVTGGDHGGAPLAIALLALGTGLALAVVVRRRATA